MQWFCCKLQSHRPTEVFTLALKFETLAVFFVFAAIEKRQTWQQFALCPLQVFTHWHIVMPFLHQKDSLFGKIAHAIYVHICGGCNYTSLIAERELPLAWRNNGFDHHTHRSGGNKIKGLFQLNFAKPTLIVMDEFVHQHARGSLVRGTTDFTTMRMHIVQCVPTAYTNSIYSVSHKFWFFWHGLYDSKKWVQDLETISMLLPDEGVFQKCAKHGCLFRFRIC